MTLKKQLEEFFLHYHKLVSIVQLIKILKVDNKDVNLLIDSLFELEKEGKIFCNFDRMFIHVPHDFCYYHGVLKKSKSNQFFIKTDDNVIIILKNVKRAKEGDFVFVSKSDVTTNHPKLFFGDIVRVVRKESVPFGMRNIVKAYLRNEGNHFYIIYNDKRIYIPKEQLHTAFAGDYVSVRVSQNLGSVIDVLERRNNEHVFCCKVIDGSLKFVPIGASYGVYDLDYDGHEGEKVIASFADGKLKFVSKFSSDHSIQSEIDALLVDYGFPRRFSNQVLADASSMNYEISGEEIAKRVDLRNLETFTIDPVDAKDLDDAVSLEFVDGIYRLYVHTANPSYYIHLNSRIFKEAFSRAFSIYPVTDVIPMLPDEFCQGVCSLNEDGDKLAITCRMDFDCNGNLLDYDIFKSVIHSNKQMNYDKVNDLLEKGNADDSYLRFYSTLLRMGQLSSLLEGKKVARGAISFESEEKKYIFDSFGNPINVLEQHRGVAQSIIENFMLIANETITKHAYYLGLPFIYRNHEIPSVQKRDSLKQNLNQKGYYIQKIGNIDNPRILQMFLSGLLSGKNKEERKIISEVVLKCMSRAFYDGKNFGHYGLALDCYGTFTSPARKISDMINHMVIDTFLDEGYMSSKFDVYRKFIDENCEYISSKQEDVDSLEKAIQYLLLNRYADNFLNVEVNARIIFVNRYGIYVKDEHGLTGVIPIKKNMNFRNSSVSYNGHDYSVGEQVKVILRKKKEDELIFDFGVSRDKKLVRKND